MEKTFNIYKENRLVVFSYVIIFQILFIFVYGDVRGALLKSLTITPSVVVLVGLFTAFICLTIAICVTPSKVLYTFKPIRIKFITLTATGLLLISLTEISLAYIIPTYVVASIKAFSLYAKLKLR